MMQLFIAALIVFAVVVLAMSVGVIFSNRCIKGSCGGAYGQIDKDGNMVCGVCGIPVDSASQQDQSKPQKTDTA